MCTCLSLLLYICGSIRVLTAPKEAPEGSGATQSKAACIFICSDCLDRYSVTNAFADLATTLGHWEGLYNKAIDLLVFHNYDRDDRVGRQCVLSFAHLCKIKSRLTHKFQRSTAFGGADN